MMLIFLQTEHSADSLNRDEFDDDLFRDLSPHITSHWNSESYNYVYGADTLEEACEHPCIDLKKILSDGTFYYSVNFDLTSRLQNR